MAAELLWCPLNDGDAEIGQGPRCLRLSGSPYSVGAVYEHGAAGFDARVDDQLPIIGGTGGWRVLHGRYPTVADARAAVEREVAALGVNLPVRFETDKERAKQQAESDTRWRVSKQTVATREAGGTRGILAIDFDDTLTAPGGVEALVELRRRGYGLVVHTANADHDGIRSWLAERWPAAAGPIPPVTDVKPQAVAFIDDKAVRFTDWADMLARFPSDFEGWHRDHCGAPLRDAEQVECSGDVHWTTAVSAGRSCRERYSCP